ncbi:hypothetical protein OIO90_006245 [Microbotryomycetes sp. JL221]|nr:hypothetical protein OIO90_006245 [Microbotryomycetes sp. JL221]
MDSAEDKPCIVCTEAGMAEQCTFSRPTRKRGPQAGITKALEDRLSVLERLLGHLMLQVPHVEPSAQAFLSEDSPPPLTTLTQDKQAYENSIVPASVEAYSSRAASSSAKGDVNVKDEQAPSRRNTNPSPSEPLTSQLHQQRTSVGSMPQSGPSHYSVTPPQVSASSNMHLQGFASPQHPMAPTLNHPPTSASAVNAAGSLSNSNCCTLKLPPDYVRLQLLDLYFNQVVQPALPILSNKNAFFRWSALLPSSATEVSPAASSDVSFELLSAVFAVATPYMPPGSGLTPLDARSFAAIGRNHIQQRLDQPTLAMVQALCLLAVADWGQGELKRAYILSGLALTIAFYIGLHDHSTEQRVGAIEHESRALMSALYNIHALLSLRQGKSPLFTHDSYVSHELNADAAEDFDLWRSDKTPSALRAERSLPVDKSIKSERPLHPAVRSSTVSTFAHFSRLCVIASRLAGWSKQSFDPNGPEHVRQTLFTDLMMWEQNLPQNLRIGPSIDDCSALQERARHTVDMHLVFFVLLLKVAANPILASEQETFDSTEAALSRCVQRYRDQFSFLRSLPHVEMALHELSRAGPSSGSGQERSVVSEGYSELAAALPLATMTERDRSAPSAMHQKRNGATTESAPTVSRTFEPVESLHPDAQGIDEPLQQHSSEPFNAFMSFSDHLGPSANSSTVLDFGTWDQSDLLVSLGLIAGPNAATKSNDWNTAPSWPPPQAYQQSSTITGNQEFQQVGAATSSTPLPVANEGLPHIGHVPTSSAEPQASMLVPGQDQVMVAWPGVMDQPMDLIDRFIARGALG